MIPRGPLKTPPPTLKYSTEKKYSMLDQLRNASKSWVAGLFVGALVLSFAVWGIGDIFRGVTSTNVAEVGGVEITADAFDQEFRSRVQQLSRQTGGRFTTDQARSFGLDRQILSRMISLTALDIIAQKIGLALSNEKLSETIKKDAVFHGITGAFNRDKYREVLASVGLNEAFYEASLRKDLVRQQLLDAIAAGPAIPYTLIKALYNYRMETRRIDFLVLRPELAGDIPPPDQETLQAFYKDHAPQFTAPEYRTFSFILARAQDFKDQIKVDEAKIREIYDFNKARFATPERRTIEVIPFLSEQEAKKAKADLAAGLTFEGIATQRGLSLADIKQENVEQSAVLDNVVGKAAFSQKKNVVSDPINGQLGWALVLVTDITPGVQQTYEEARQVIRDEMVSQEAQDKLYELSNNLEDEIASGASLEDAAARVGKNLVTISGVDKKGFKADGTKPAALPDVPEILKAAFSQDVGFPSELKQAEDEGYFVLRVDNITPSVLKPFDQVRAEVEQAYYKQAKKDRMESLAQSVAARANAGEPFKDIAATFGRSVLSTRQPINRNFTNQTFSAELVAQLFASKVDKFVYGNSAFGDSQVVAATREIIKPDIAAAGKDIEAIREQAAQSYSAGMIDQFVAGVQQQMDIKVYPEVVESVLGPRN